MLPLIPSSMFTLSRNAGVEQAQWLRLFNAGVEQAQKKTIKFVKYLKNEPGS